MPLEDEDEPVGENELENSQGPNQMKNLKSETYYRKSKHLSISPRWLPKFLWKGLFQLLYSNRGHTKSAYELKC